MTADPARDLRQAWIDHDRKSDLLRGPERTDFLDGRCVLRWSDEASTWIVDYTKQWGT